MNFGVVLQTDPPLSRVIELARRAESLGFSHVWVFDSPLLWQEPFVALSHILAATEEVTVGPMVTNPGTRDWTVLASTFATLNDIYGPRTVCAIGRGDSAVRTIGRKPRTLAAMVEAMQVIKGLVAGRKVPYRETTVQFPWLASGWDLPIWGAGYGPRALDSIGRHADGFVLQLADPQILEWTRAAVADAARDHGRSPGALTTCVVAPAYVGDDIAHQREQLRWFGGMVGNHVADIVARYGEGSGQVPEALTEYIKNRADYDYSHHGRAGNPSTDFVPDDIVDRFCVLGRAEDHVAKLRTLQDLGTDHFAIYLMHDAEDETLEAYGRTVLPAMGVEPSRSPSGRTVPAPDRPAAVSAPAAPARPGYSGRTGFGVRPALLVVDFIRGFTAPESGIGVDYREPLHVTAALMTAFRECTLPVLFTSHCYRPDASDGGVFLKKVPALGVLTRGSPWVKVDQRIAPRPDERVLEKQQASAFFGTGLDTELRSRGVDTVVIVGCTTSGNIRASAVDAMQHGFKTVVVRDAVGDRVPAAHEANLSDLDAKYADVVWSEAVMDHLRNYSKGRGLTGPAAQFRSWWHDPNAR